MANLLSLLWSSNAAPRSPRIGIAKNSSSGSGSFLSFLLLPFHTVHDGPKSSDSTAFGLLNSLDMMTPSYALPEGTVLALKGPSLFIDQDLNSVFPPPPSPDCTHPARPRFEALLAKDGPIQSSTPWVLRIDEFVTGGPNALSQSYVGRVKRASGHDEFEVHFTLARPSLLPTWSLEDSAAHSTSPGLLLEKDYAFYS